MEVAQLPPEIVLGNVGAAYIVAQAHRDAVCQRGFCAFNHAVKDDLSVILVFFRRARNGSVKQRIGQCGGDGRAQKCAPLLVQTNRLLVHFCAVLNGIYTVFQRSLHARRRFGMSGNSVAQLVGCIADGFDHLRRHLHLAGRALFGGIQHAAGDHQLDKVYLLCAGLFQLRQRLGVVVCRYCYRACHVPARHRDALVGGQNAGCQHLSGGAVVPAAGVKVRNAAHGAHGGHTAQQLQLGITAHQPVCDGAGQPVAQDLTYQRCIVPGLCAGFAVARQMDVQVDEPRAQIPAVQVDDLVAVKAYTRICNGGDLIVFGQQHLALYRFHLLGTVQKNTVCVCALHVFHPLSVVFLECRLPYPSNFSCARYCSASSRESSSSRVLPARSATVRATRKMRSCARAESPSAS